MTFERDESGLGVGLVKLGLQLHEGVGLDDDLLCLCQVDEDVRRLLGCLEVRGEVLYILHQ